MGGTFAGLWSLLWWPWTFWTFGIALACLGLMSYWVLPAVPLKEEEQGLTFTQRLHELDLLGATVGITAMILFNFAWNQAPGFGWEQPYIYALLIVGFLLFPVFFWIELRVSKHPLIPFDALKTDVIFVMVCEMCGWAAFGMSSHSLQVILLTATRNLHILLYPNPPTTPRNVATPHHGPDMSRHYLRTRRCNHDWSCYLSHRSRLGDADLHVCIHHRQHYSCDYARASNLLGASICRHTDHALGYGYELSCWNTYHE